MLLSNKNGHPSGIEKIQEDALDKAIDDYFEKFDFKEFFTGEIAAIRSHLEVVKEANAESTASLHNLCTQFGIEPPPITEEEEEEDDENDVMIVADNIDLFTNRISVSSKVFVKKGKWMTGDVVLRDYMAFEDVFDVQLHTDPTAVIQVFGNQVAFFEPLTTRVDVGTRVVAYNHQSLEWMSGVIAEYPRAQNNTRYLVFFDNGMAQYCINQDLRLIFEAREPVWEDIEDESMAEYIKLYLDLFPHIPTLKTKKGTRLNIIKGQQWMRAEVREIDASMMLLAYKDGVQEVTEWIYRGSRRLELLHREYKAFQKKSRTARFSTASRSKRSYVVYTIIPDEDDTPVEMIDLDPCESALQQGKSKTSKPNDEGETRKEMVVNEKNESRGKKKDEGRQFLSPQDCSPATAGHLVNTSAISSIANRVRNKEGQSHDCKGSCLMVVGECMNQAINPLMLPMRHGWERSIKFGRNGGKKGVLYVSYCGLVLKTIEEVDSCLLHSNSPLTIDKFSFDPNLDVLTEFVLKKKNIEIKDYSLGRENVPVPCVNSVDTHMPPFLEYTTTRVPARDVYIEQRPEFLAGCSCTDGCRDRSKCECIQFTISEAKQFSVGKASKAGYSNRTLKKPMVTGIYECNSNCSCDHRCHNRVVQNGLTLKLQLFKTDKKGWGLRCLNDIQAGQFICNYTGQILTDEVATEGGKAFGDEYLADLDYIEALEKRKIGFEKEVFEDVFFGDEEEEEEEDRDEIESIIERDFSFTPSTPLKRKPSKKVISERALKKRCSSFSKLTSPSPPLLYHESNSSNSNDNSNFSNSSNSNDNSNFSNSCKSSSNKTSFAKDAEEVKETKSTKDDNKSNTIERKIESNSTIERKIVMNEEGDDRRMEDTGGRHNIEELCGRSCLDPGKEASKKNIARKNSISLRKRLQMRELLGDQGMYIIDTKAIGNLGRFINHSCSPNMFVQNVFVDTHDLRFPWVAFFSLKLIKAGSELTWDYGYEVGTVEGKEIICHCGSSKCSGRLL